MPSVPLYEVVLVGIIVDVEATVEYIEQQL